MSITLEPKLTKYIPYVPHPKQAAFLLLDDYPEVLYGGAGGGGKTIALLMAALQHIDVPNYNALLLRRTYPELSQPLALLDLARQWLAGTDAHWNGMEKRYRFPNGANLVFGYLATETDKYRYQGGGWQYVGFDELTQFEENQYTFLFGWLRKLEGMTVPLRMRAGTNPIGPGREWVKRRFITDGPANDRVFVPAKAKDNPSINWEEYRRSLSNLDPVTRMQIEDGNWDAVAAGNIFKRHWFRAVDAVPHGLRRVRFWDLAATEAAPGKDPSWTVGLMMGERDGQIFVLDVARDRATPYNVERMVENCSEFDGDSVEVGMEQEPGSSGKAVIQSYAKLLNTRKFTGYPATGDKVVRIGPFSSQCQAGNVAMLRGNWNEAFLSELSLFPGGGHDDQVIAAAGAYLMLTESSAIDTSQIVMMGERIRPDW